MVYFTSHCYCLLFIVYCFILKSTVGVTGLRERGDIRGHLLAAVMILDL